jgi:hypothetical protein
VGTLTVKLECTHGVSYLGLEYEGDEVFACLCDYCSAKEFGSMQEAFDAVELAKWQGLKFNHFQVMPF